MMPMEKQAVGKQTGGFMQTRKGRRPIRADNLIAKGGKKPSEAWNEMPAEDSKAGDTFLSEMASGDTTDEFNKVGADQKEAIKRRLRATSLIAKRDSSYDPNWSLKGTPPYPLELEGAVFDKVGHLKDKLAQAVRARRGEFAPGIPIERRIKPISEVREEDPNEDWDISVSMHPARRRGDHIDLRLVDPKGKAHSWALTQPRMPEPGKSSYAVQQATHSGRYAMRTRPFTIPEGYGATRPGTKVQPMDVGGTEIVHANQDKVRFLTHRGQQTNEFVLRRIRGTRADDGKPMWALHNATRNVGTVAGQKIPLGKPKYRDQRVGDIDVHDDQQLVQAKIDGSHVLVQMEGPERPNRVYSYRQAKRDTGLIEHTFKFPDYHKRKSPPSLKGTVVRAELWASKKGKAVPAERVGAILNSAVPKSRQMQQESGEKLRLSAFDVVKHKGRDVSQKPYAEKLKILQEVTQNVPGIEMPPMAASAREKLRLIKKIKDGKLPHTAEGTVQWDLHRAGAAPRKAKIRPDQDVYVKDVFTKSRGEARGHAGGFTYSTTPGGPAVGRVGTGFDHRTRADMQRNPGRYVGRVAKVESQGAHKSGALRAPAFKEWHIDKTDPELLEGK